LCQHGIRFFAVAPPFRAKAFGFAQCAIRTDSVTVHWFDGPSRFRHYLQDQAVELSRQSGFGKPTVYFLKDSLERDRYDAVSFGRSNSRARPTLSDTIWITSHLPNLAVGLAHELAHILMDSGEHTMEPGNLMLERTAENNIRITRDQCERITTVGKANGLLHKMLR
jgi:hypothetical protein